MLDGVSILSERVIKPSRWRKQHGRVEAVNDQMQDVDGNIGAPYRGIGLLDEWERSGKITREMRQAGDKFHENFHLACLDPIQAADMARIGGSPGPMKHRGSIDARDAIRGALAALGGPESQSGCGAWYVLGCELSIRQWVERESWRGRRLNQHAAAGIMIGVLDTLKPHFGY